MVETSVAGFLTLGEALNEILCLAPMVVALRTDVALGGLSDPWGMPATESVRMVMEKIDAATEGAMAAVLEAGAAFGRSLTGQEWPLIAAVGVAVAAVEPTRVRLRDNVRRLGGAAEQRLLPAAA